MNKIHSKSTRGDTYSPTELNINHTDNAQPSKYKLANFNTLSKFASELDIEIPDRLLKKHQLYDKHYFFTSNEEFNVSLARAEFTDLSMAPILAFGQSGYGFNSGIFSIFYADDAFTYHFEIPFGGAFTDNANGAKRITAAFFALNNFIQNNTLPKGGRTVVAIADGLENGSPKFANVDRSSGEVVEIDNLSFY
ncbi:MAG: hypothetical protein LBI81_00075 [Puniceicoccales bacterium]|jgi:hypothetical protein|nr:hypothetical protein [Puniceicoccales bacterium]